MYIISVGRISIYSHSKQFLYYNYEPNSSHSDVLNDTNKHREKYEVQ